MLQKRLELLDPVSEIHWVKSIIVMPNFEKEVEPQETKVFMELNVRSFFFRERYAHLS